MYYDNGHILMENIREETAFTGQTGRKKRRDVTKQRTGKVIWIQVA
jgi:hypothetical protein